jgi:branched-chain amino acid transport system ATP-binding protein
MLETRGLITGYGRHAVVHGVDLSVAAGEIVALLGANGAGKSTLLKTLSGLLPVHSGQILFEGRPIERLSPRERVLLGIVHVPEGRQICAGLSIAENLRLGAYALHGLSDAVKTRRIYEVCERFPVLLERLREPAGRLSGGQQQMLAIARGLMAQPRLLMLDEPSLGLAPVLLADIFKLIQSLRTQGQAILLSEQNARRSLAIADRGYVIETGCVSLQGGGRALLDDANVAERYLGVGKAAGVLDDRQQAQLVSRLKEIMGSPRSAAGSPPPTPEA